MSSVLPSRPKSILDSGLTLLGVLLGANLIPGLDASNLDTLKELLAGQASLGEKYQNLAEKLLSPTVTRQSTAAFYFSIVAYANRAISHGHLEMIDDLRVDPAPAISEDAGFMSVLENILSKETRIPIRDDYLTDHSMSVILAGYVLGKQKLIIPFEKLSDRCWMFAALACTALQPNNLINELKPLPGYRPQSTPRTPPPWPRGAPPFQPLLPPRGPPSFHRPPPPPLGPPLLYQHPPPPREPSQRPPVVLPQLPASGLVNGPAKQPTLGQTLNSDDSGSDSGNDDGSECDSDHEILVRAIRKRWGDQITRDLKQYFLAAPEDFGVREIVFQRERASVSFAVKMAVEGVLRDIWVSDRGAGWQFIDGEAGDCS